MNPAEQTNASLADGLDQYRARVEARQESDFESAFRDFTDKKSEIDMIQRQGDELAMLNLCSIRLRALPTQELSRKEVGGTAHAERAAACAREIRNAIGTWMPRDAMFPESLTDVFNRIISKHFPDSAPQPSPDAKALAEKLAHEIIAKVNPEIAAMIDSPDWHPRMYGQRFDDVLAILAPHLSRTEDTGRLDWLESAKCDLAETEGKWYLAGLNNRQNGKEYPSPRAAIDAAMSATPTEAKEAL